MLRFIDLFAGTGGMRLGLEQAAKELGIDTKCVFSSEINKNAAKSYKLNFEEDPLCDITTVDADSIPDFDFLLAGFPCQAFSYAGRMRGFADTRGTLFFDIERILEAKKPRYFLLENVRGLTSHDRGKTFEVIVNRLKGLGYVVKHYLLNSSNFGIPQNRVRIYIFGSLDRDINLNINSCLGAADTHKFFYKNKKKQMGLFESRINETLLVKDILEEKVSKKYYCSLDFTNRLKKVVGNDLNKLHGYRLIDYRGGRSIHSWELGLKGECTSNEIKLMNSLIANRRKKIFGTHQDGKSLTKEQIRTFFDVFDLDEILESLVNKNYLSCRNGRYNPVSGNMSFEVFKFLEPEGISITLTSSDCDRLGIVQNNYPRRLTPRECARLQGFPDTYKLIDDDRAVYHQMGNAVTVTVVQSILEEFLEKNYTRTIA